MTTESNQPSNGGESASPARGLRARSLLALAAGLLMPGLGHVYAGDPVRGAGFLLAVGLAVPVAARLALAGPARLLCFVAVAGVLAAVGLYVCSAIAAFRLARKSGISPKRPWQRVGVYLLYVVVGYVFVLGPLTSRARAELLETFVVPSASMAPSVLPGDRVLADKTVGSVGGAKLWRGALAIFVYPNDRTSMFIKRIVGLPGDRVEIDGRRLIVNGHDVAAGDTDAPARQGPGQGGGDGMIAARERGDHGEYSVLWPREAPATAPTAATAAADRSAFVVPAGQVFVLGDNRTHAFDSRRFGTVPLTDIKGLARQVWFSAHGGAGVRWGRIGKLLE